MLLWPHLAFIAASTLAAGRFTERPDRFTDVCALHDPCLSVNESATVQSALAPLALYFCAFVVLYTPSLLLASRTRLAQLQEATFLVACLAPILVLIWQLQATRPTLTYAISVHWVIGLFSCTPLVTPVAGIRFHTVLAWAAGLTVLVYAWGFGPPLPVVDSPVVSQCCGAVTHLTALAVTDVGLCACTFAMRKIVLA